LLAEREAELVVARADLTGARFEIILPLLD
jgi:hypothetical protein